MNKELSDETFESRLQYLLGDVLTYVDFRPSSQVDVILLHEHFGLQNYVRVMGQTLIYDEVSIVLPNLFGEALEEEESQEPDNKDYLLALDHEKVAKTALSIINYVAKRGNRVVLIGFSLGASIGLKLLEHTDKVDSAFFFYGVPPLAAVRPELIQAAVTIFMGTEDKMNHLSNAGMIRKTKEVYQSNPIIQVVEMEGGSHGFVNPACERYSESLFEVCCDTIHQKLKQLTTEPKISRPRVMF